MYHFRRNPQPLPPFRSAYEIVRATARLVRPKSGLTVSQWATKYLGHDEDVLPWQIEVKDALGHPETAEVDLMGPTQLGKTEIGMAWIGHCIDQNPGDFLVCQSAKDLADDFVKRRLAPMVDKVEVVKSALLPTASADNVFLKQFRGMLLSTIWPVAGQFQARPIKNGWLDEYDKYPDDIEGHGDGRSLLSGRQPSFEGRDTKFITSSPSREDGGGIEALVELGTDERLVPECPQCGERVALDTIADLLYEGTTPDEAAATAYVKCPKNGCILRPDDKFDLMASFHRLPHKGFVAQRPDAGPRHRSFRVDGLYGWRSWDGMARLHAEAVLAFETRQDEGPLRTYYNTVAGKNYRSVLMGEKPLEADDLARLREPGWRMGTVPKGPVVITVSVDCQSDRFEVTAKGWADGMESWTIERWSIDVLEDGVTQLDPFRQPEHWRVLLPLFDKTWPLAGVKGARSPKPLGVAIDTGGGGDKNVATATENAKKFWHLAIAAGIPKSRIMLLKGTSRHDAPLVRLARHDDRKVKGTPIRKSPELWLVNSHAGKSILDARLRRQSPGPGYVHLPANFDDGYLLELTAEQRDKKGKWQKVRPRNETLDLEIYAWFALIKPPFAKSRSTMRWVPYEFRVRWPEQSGVVTDEVTPPSDMAMVKENMPVEETLSSIDHAPTRQGGSDWIGPVGNWL